MLRFNDYVESAQIVALHEQVKLVQATLKTEVKPATPIATEDMQEIIQALANLNYLLTVSRGL